MVAIRLVFFILKIIAFAAPVLQAQQLVLQLKGSKTEIGVNESKIDLNLIITNRQSQSVVLYGFAAMEPGVGPVAEYQKGDNTCATALFFEREKQLVYLMKMPPLRWSLKAPTDSLKAYYKSFELDLESTKLLLSSGDSASRKVEISLHKNLLEKGTYNLYVVYYSGNNLPNVVDKQKIDDYARLNGAIVFQGAVKSNVIKLYVR